MIGILLEENSNSFRPVNSEKVTICILCVMLSLFIVGGIGFLPIYFCQASTLYTTEQLDQVVGEEFITLYGKIYDVSDFGKRHPGGPQAIANFVGEDATSLFPRTPPSQLPAFCLDLSKTEYLTQHQTPECDIPEEYLAKGAVCHDSLVGKGSVDNRFKTLKKGDIVMPDSAIGADDMQWIVIDKNIYNVTQYVDGLRHNRTNVISTDPSHPNAYLLEALHLMIVHKLNQDATAVYNDVFSNDDYKL